MDPAQSTIDKPPAVSAEASPPRAGEPASLHLPYWMLRAGARLDLPDIGKLLKRAGVWDQPRWAGAPERETRGLWHGCRMRLELSDFHQRGAYFYGRLLDLSVQAFIMATLRPGDDCIDLGANIGLLTMAAAGAVGPRGQVLAVEPNPDAFERLEWHIHANRLEYVHVAAVAASDREAVMTLSVPPTGNTGAGSLGTLLPRHGGRTSAKHDVPLRRGDDLVTEMWTGGGGDTPVDSDAPFLLVKIDVEGHETAALRGLARTIQRRRPVILAEINPYMLSTNGSSEEELLGMLREWGYRAYHIAAARRGLRRRPVVRLSTLPEEWRAGDRTVNVVFLNEAGELPGRVKRLLS